MAKITFHGEYISTSGDLPKVGTETPSFTLISNNLDEVFLSKYKGKKKILNIVPSIDTSICFLSVITFEKYILKEQEVVLLTISRDTPFAQKRFCKDQKIKKNILLSDISHTFGITYGIDITTGPLKYLLARAVIILDATNTIVYTELVSEITKEPNYKKAITALQKKE